MLALRPAALAVFHGIAERERCPYAVIGATTGRTANLIVSDPLLGGNPVHMPAAALLGKPPRMRREVRSVPAPTLNSDEFAGINLREAWYRVLQLPAVADKTFLVTIGDRTVGGLISRDQFVGPWQVPVADVGVTLSDYQHHSGEALAIGERTPTALLDPAASARMAAAEAVINHAGGRHWTASMSACRPTGWRPAVNLGEDAAPSAPRCAR